MAFKLLQAAQRHGADSTCMISFRIRVGIIFKDELQVEQGEQRPERKAGKIAS